MSTRVRWLGHATLLLESDGRTVLIDPFLTGNPKAAAKAPARAATGRANGGVKGRAKKAAARKR